MSTLGQCLERGDVLVLDGGVSTEIQRREVPMSEGAWSGAAVLEHPEVVQAVHRDYIAAGADIITCNTYASGRHHLAAAGLGERVREVNEKAVALALAARDEVAAQRPIHVAGSMSLMAPSFDSRYRPAVDAMHGHFAEQAQILAGAGVDVIILEMLRDVVYSRAAIDAALATGLPVWCGFSCARSAAGGMMMSAGVGDPLPFVDVLDAVLGRGESLVAVMHSEVDVIAPALEEVIAAWDGPLAAYPNSGHFEQPNWVFVDMVSPADLASAAMGWVERGVQVVGGCCGVSPEHIRAIRQKLDARV